MSDKEQDWQRKLNDEEFRVTRQAGTERPFTGALLNESREGDYLCKCCGAPLFKSGAKFDAGCGWPSFFEQSIEDNVGYREDNTHGMHRVEIYCKKCNAHLGHVFPDGPEPSGQRYCVNSLSMTFKSENDETVKG